MMPAILLGLAAAALLFVNRWSYLRRHNAQPEALGHIGMSLAVAGGAMLTVALAEVRFPAAIAPASLVLIGLAAYDAGDLASFRFLGNPLSANLRHLPFSWRSPNMLKQAPASLRAYFPYRRFLLSSLALLLVLAVATGLDLRLAPAATVAAFSAGVGLSLSRARPKTPRVDLTGIDWRILAADATLATTRLSRADRAGSFTLKEQPAFLPDGVVIVVLESAGRHLRSVSNPEHSLTERIVELSGVADQWLCPTNMIANSSCTDVVVPALMTGAAPHESVQKLNRLPFVFDLAKARDYRTGFFTSATLDLVEAR